MTPERQELAFEIFDAAIARPEAERERFVALTCVDDQELGAEVRSLLAAHVDASGFLFRRAQSASRPLVDSAAPAPPARALSSNGGMEPIWRSDGRELFYLDPDLTAPHLFAAQGRCWIRS